MTLDASQYRDPFEVLADKQAQAARKHAQCGQCIHASRGVFKGQDLPICTQPRQTYGYQCFKYQTKGAK